MATPPPLPRYSPGWDMDAASVHGRIQRDRALSAAALRDTFYSRVPEPVLKAYMHRIRGFRGWYAPEDYQSIFWAASQDALYDHKYRAFLRSPLSALLAVKPAVGAVLGDAAQAELAAAAARLVAREADRQFLVAPGGQPTERQHLGLNQLMDSVDSGAFCRWAMGAFRQAQALRASAALEGLVRSVLPLELVPCILGCVSDLQPGDHDGATRRRAAALARADQGAPG